MPSPSSALASFTVTAALSSSLMVPVPVSLTVTPVGAPDTLKPTVKVSLASSTASSSVETVNVLVSPLVPLKSRSAVFSS